MTIAIGEQRVPQFTVADRLRKARELTGLNQAEFAAEVGISMRSIGRYEAGHAVKKSVILLYAMRTGVPQIWIERGIAPTEKLPDLDSNQEPIGLQSGRRVRTLRASVPRSAA